MKAPEFIGAGRGATATQVRGTTSRCEKPAIHIPFRDQNREGGAGCVWDTQGRSHCTAQTLPLPEVCRGIWAASWRPSSAKQRSAPAWIRTDKTTSTAHGPQLQTSSPTTQYLCCPSTSCCKSCHQLHVPNQGLTPLPKPPQGCHSTLPAGLRAGHHTERLRKR